MPLKVLLSLLSNRAATVKAKRKLIRDVASLDIKHISVIVQMVWEICPDAITVCPLFLV